MRACVFMSPVFHFHPDSSRCNRYASHPGPHHPASALDAAFPWHAAHVFFLDLDMLRWSFCSKEQVRFLRQSSGMQEREDRNREGVACPAPDCPRRSCRGGNCCRWSLFQAAKSTSPLKGFDGSLKKRNWLSRNVEKGKLWPRNCVFCIFEKRSSVCVRKSRR